MNRAPCWYCGEPCDYDEPQPVCESCRVPRYWVQKQNEAGECYKVSEHRHLGDAWAEVAELHEDGWDFYVWDTIEKEPL